MSVGIDTEFRNGIDSLIGWWALAGVDVDVAEERRDWLAPAAPARPVAISVSPPAVVVERPPTVEAFHAWLASDTTLLGDAPARCRLAPAGPVEAGLMVLTDMPEAGDADAGQLLTGEVGQLLDRMLAAMGRDRASIYLATIMPARVASGRISDESVDALADMVRHHVALAAPAKLWLLGRAASRAVLGIDERAAAGRLHVVHHDTATTEAIATQHPRVLLREPKSKARAWADMQRLMETTA